jgi:hypothetical protein
MRRAPQGATCRPPISQQALVARGNAVERALGRSRSSSTPRPTGSSRSSRASQAPIDEAFRLLTMERNNWHQADQPDKAIEPYEKAMVFKPRDFPAREELVGALNLAVRGDVSTKRQQAIKIAEEASGLTSSGSTGWARMQNNLGNARRGLTTGDKPENLKKAIAAYELGAHRRHQRGRTRRVGANAIEPRRCVEGCSKRREERELEASGRRMRSRARRLYQRRQHFRVGNNTIRARQRIAANDPQGKAENLKQAIAAYQAQLSVRRADSLMKRGNCAPISPRGCLPTPR